MNFFSSIKKDPVWQYYDNVERDARQNKRAMVKRSVDPNFRKTIENLYSESILLKTLREAKG